MTYSVEHLWLEFSTATMPPDAPDVQRVETRRAFYAGVYALLVLLRDTIGSPEISEERGASILEEMMGECEDFYRDVKAGKA